MGHHCLTRLFSSWDMVESPHNRLQHPITAWKTAFFPYIRSSDDAVCDRGTGTQFLQSARVHMRGFEAFTGVELLHFALAKIIWKYLSMEFPIQCRNPEIRSEERYGHVGRLTSKSTTSGELVPGQTALGYFIRMRYAYLWEPPSFREDDAEVENCSFGVRLSMMLN